MSKALHKLPSELLFVVDPFAAFCLNRAVWLFGSTIDAELDAVKGKEPKEIEKKRLKVMRKHGLQAADASGFADPAKREQ